MVTKRMSREEFFAKLSPLDSERLRQVLWNLYWRGSTPLQERIEGELDPAGPGHGPGSVAGPAGPGLVLDEVREFVELARAGAYNGSDRRVPPHERTRWRVTFRRLAADAESGLRAEDSGPAQEALALIIDLACEMRDHQYVRSEDPVEAARFVVSDAAAMLWETAADRHGFQAFADLAAPQLIRWESRYGWTRGWGQVHAKETSLASVLARLLHGPDAWAVFAGSYLDALTAVARAEASRSWGHHDSNVRRQRASDLAEWHELLLVRLAGSRAEDLLDRLVHHTALGGPELTFLRARLARQRGNLDGARKLAQDCLQDLPGHEGFAGFAAEIGADLPPRARELADQRSRSGAAGAAAGSAGSAGAAGSGPE